MANAPSSLAQEPVVFGSSIEALVTRALGPKVDAAIQAKLNALKIDLQNLRVAYDYTTWHELQGMLAATIYPGVASDEAHRRLGRDFLRGLEHTLIGKATLAASRLAGTRRTLERMTRNVRTVNNYIENRLEPLPDGTFRMEYFVVPELVPVMARLPPPSVHYFVGILEGLLEATGSKNGSVSIEQNDLERRYAVIRVRLS